MQEHRFGTIVKITFTLGLLAVIAPFLLFRRCRKEGDQADLDARTSCQR